MNEEIDFDLTPQQWETLKALRTPAAKHSAPSRLAIQDLVALGLASMSDRSPAITPAGRKALIRGSFRLWDAAA